jgi:hypothetical protein
MNQKDFNHIFVNTIKNQTPPSSELLGLIKDSPKLSAKRAIEVYQEDYLSRLTEALKNTYRGIYSLIGEDDFKKLSQDFIACTPSSSKDLDDYGANFSDFCKDHPHSQLYEFLSSLASLEWEFRLLFHRGMSLGLTADQLPAAIETGAKLILTPSCKLLTYPYLISELYAIKDLDEDQSHPFDYKKPEWLVLYKKENLIFIKAITQSQWEFLKLLEFPLNMLEWVNMASDQISSTEIQQLFEFIGSANLIEVRQPF